MNAILSMREKRAAAWDSCKKFLDEHRGENGMMSAEDSAIYDKMEQDVVNYGKEIERLERQAAIDAELNSTANTALLNTPSDMGDEKKGIASDSYKGAFWNAMRGKPVVYNALQVGTDSEGGYLVPDEFERTLVQALEEENVFRRFATKIRTQSGAHKIPVVAQHGTAGWMDEEGYYFKQSEEVPGVESDEVFTQVSLGAYKLGTAMRVSEELLNDSAFNLASYIATEFGRRIGAAEEEAFITGNGSGKPLGALAASGGAGTGVTTSSQTTFTMEEIMDLFYSLKAPYRRKAVWLMNDATVKALRKLKTGDGVYLWQPSLIAGQPDMLMNRPVYTSAYMPTIAHSAKPILFADLSYYWIADRETRTLRRLNEHYADRGQVGFLASERVDGKLILTEAAKCMAMA